MKVVGGLESSDHKKLLTKGSLLSLLYCNFCNIFLLTFQNPSIVPQLVELLSSSFSNAECAASILSKCCQVG